MFGYKINESDRICYLLLSLPDEYETVVTALETQTYLKLDFVKANLLDEETKSKSNKMLQRVVSQMKYHLKQQAQCVLIVEISATIQHIVLDGE